MQINWLLMLVVTLNLIFSTVGDVLAKVWGITNNIHWLYIGLGVNIFTIFFYMVAVKVGGLAITTTVVLLLTVCISVVLGFVVFHEKIDPIQWIGIGMGLLSILLVLHVFTPAA